LPSALKDVALVAQELEQRRARVDLVVDDQDPSLAVHGAWGSSR